MAGSVASARAMSGNDGRYMSTASGPSAVRSESSAVNANVSGRSI